MENNIFKMSGSLHKKLPVKDISDNFKKQEFILLVDDLNYKGEPIVQYARFQCVQNNILKLTEMDEGSNVLVEFKITGRMWENDKGKIMYFTNLDVMDINLIDSEGGVIEKTDNDESFGMDSSTPDPLSNPDLVDQGDDVSKELYGESEKDDPLSDNKENTESKEDKGDGLNDLPF